MAKLYFRYGAMNSGKSTAVLQVAFNYEERGMRVLTVKPAIDTKAGASISSRLGVEREVDVLIGPEDTIESVLRPRLDGIACVLVDEAQFLTPSQVDELLRVAVIDGIPVICYGLRTDFQTVVFPGAARLLAVAHSLEETKTICRCGKKATFNARLVNGKFVSEGDQVAIDNGATVTYESMCPGCYFEMVGA